MLCIGLTAFISQKFGVGTFLVFFNLNFTSFIVSSWGHIFLNTPHLSAVQVRGDSLDQGLHHHNLLSFLLLRGHCLGHLFLLVLHLIPPEPVLVQHSEAIDNDGDGQGEDEDS